MNELNKVIYPDGVSADSEHIHEFLRDSEVLVTVLVEDDTDLGKVHRKRVMLFLGSKKIVSLVELLSDDLVLSDVETNRDYHSVSIIVAEDKNIP